MIGSCRVDHNARVIPAERIWRKRTGDWHTCKPLSFLHHRSLEGTRRDSIKQMLATETLFVSGLLSRAQPRRVMTR